MAEKHSTKTCLECGRKFLPRKAGRPQVVCSNECRNERGKKSLAYQTWAKKRTSHASESRPDRFCKQCGKSIGKFKQKEYCSSVCGERFRLANLEGYRGEKNARQRSRRRSDPEYYRLWKQRHRMYTSCPRCGAKDRAKKCRYCVSCSAAINKERLKKFRADPDNRIHRNAMRRTDKYRKTARDRANERYFSDQDFRTKCILRSRETRRTIAIQDTGLDLLCTVVQLGEL